MAKPSPPSFFPHLIDEDVDDGMFRDLLTGHPRIPTYCSKDPPEEPPLKTYESALNLSKNLCVGLFLGFFFGGGNIIIIIVIVLIISCLSLVLITMTFAVDWALKTNYLSIMSEPGSVIKYSQAHRLHLVKILSQFWTLFVQSFVW